MNRVNLISKSLNSISEFSSDSLTHLFIIRYSIRRISPKNLTLRRNCESILHRAKCDSRDFAEKFVVFFCSYKKIRQSNVITFKCIVYVDKKFHSTKITRENISPLTIFTIFIKLEHVIEVFIIIKIVKRICSCQNIRTITVYFSL